MIQVTRLTRFVCLAVLFLCACEGTRPAPDAVTVAAPKRVPTVVFVTDKGEVPVVVDVAKTPTQREQGLMWVEHMADNRGMVFLMGPERLLTFWMKNTYIPLDMFFIREDGTIAYIAENTVPHSLDTVGVKEPVLGVLELAGGSAKRLGIRAGDTVYHRVFRNKD